jgi:hypothetical protein
LARYRPQSLQEAFQEANILLDGIGGRPVEAPPTFVQHKKRIVFNAVAISLSPYQPSLAACSQPGHEAW